MCVKDSKRYKNNLEVTVSWYKLRWFLTISNTFQASDWSSVITWPGYWSLIGREWLRSRGHWSSRKGSETQSSMIPHWTRQLLTDETRRIVISWKENKFISLYNSEKRTEVGRNIFPTFIHERSINNIGTCVSDFTPLPPPGCRDKLNIQKRIII